MLEILQQIHNLLPEIGGLAGPPTEMKDGESVIGEMSEGEKKIFTVLHNYNLECAQLDERLKEACPPAPNGDTQVWVRTADHVRISLWADALKDILFLSIRERLRLWSEDDACLGIRRGFKIVRNVDSGQQEAEREAQEATRLAGLFIEEMISRQK